MKKIIYLLILSLFILTSCTVPGEAPKSDDLEKIETEQYYAFKPKEYTTGIIFCGKSDVAILAYEELANKLAKEGYIVFLLKSNKNINISAKTIQEEFANVVDWYIGGHSSGGIAAAKYLENNHIKYQGLFLLAAFSNVDLSNIDIKILTVYGDEDKVLKKEHYEEKLPNLGKQYLEFVIEGGNHSFFGNYGLDENDEAGSISYEEQMDITVEHIKTLITSEKQQIIETPPATIVPTPPPLTPPVTIIPTPITPVIPQGPVTINYEESIETFVNPDRGFYEPIIITCNTEGVSAIKEELLFNNSFLHLRIDISAFSSKYNGKKDLELTTNMLNALDAMFKQIDETGAFVIIRFAYDNNYSGNIDMEPNTTMILKHIEQFTPLINKYKRCITAVECGLVGPWGEMHSSAIANQTTYNKIFDKFLACLDKDVKFLVRRPEFIYKYYGLSLSTLHKFDYKNNRIACFNDGYLGSSSDLGTFKDRDDEISFLEKINATNPYGGEVTVPDSEYNHLSWACDEMFRTNLTYLNLHWNDEVISRWKNTTYRLTDPLYKGQTEFKYIENHLGYRFVCETLEYSITEQLNFKLTIKNVGFGELFKAKKGFIILKNEDYQYAWNFDYKNELIIEQNIDINRVKSGDYQLYFVLADEFRISALRGIRFANTNMYDETTKANLLATITIA